MTQTAAAADLDDDDDLRSILGLLARGFTCDTTAREVGTSPRTVRRRIRAACDQVGVTTTTQLLVWAARRGLV